MPLTITETTIKTQYGPPIYEQELAEGRIGDERRVLARYRAEGDRVVLWEAQDVCDPHSYGAGSHELARQLVEGCVRSFQREYEEEQIKHWEGDKKVA